MIKQNRETTIVLKCCLLSCPGVSSAALEDHRYRYKPKFNIFFLEPIKPNTILAAIDREILKLQQARALLVTNVHNEPVTNQQGTTQGSDQQEECFGHSQDCEGHHEQ
jgi:hypothetical protein